MTPVQDARRHAGATRSVRGQRRRPRDPLAGDRRREPLRRRGLRGAARRPPGRVSRASARRSARPANGDVTEEPLEEFLPKRRERLLLSVSFDEPAAGAFAGLDRPHTHDYTALAVSGARAADGTLRLAATGAGSWGSALPSAEAAAGDPAAAGEAALQGRHAHTTTRSPRPGTGRRCSRCSCAASSTS